MMLNNEQNHAFLTDTRRVAAEKKVVDLAQRIRWTVNAYPPSAEYYLTALPPLLDQLTEAAETLTIVEAEVEAEILGADVCIG